MTSLLTPPDTQVADGGPRTRDLVRASVTGALIAATAPLVLCCSLAVVGWFLADAGAHGAPRDALAVGGLAWLVAHGSGIRVGGTWVTALPLLLTLGVAWSVWRAGLRVGAAVSGHGPDADRIADGERDWTVPSALALFGATYLVVVVAVQATAATASAAPSLPRALLGTSLLCLVAAGPAIAVGSGRAAVWAALLPPPVLSSAVLARAVLRWVAGVSALVLLVALVWDLASAANIISQLRLDTADTVVVVLLSLLLVPNAVVFSGSYLLGPGFAVGSGTLVAPTAVVLGPLPLFPLLAALPGGGAVAWTPALMALPPLVAAVATWRVLATAPRLPWDVAAVRAAGGGLLAALVVSLLAALAGGAVGPGRMQQVGPGFADVLVHAVPALVLGAVAGAVMSTWWRSRRETDS